MADELISGSLTDTQFDVGANGAATDGAVEPSQNGTAQHSADPSQQNGISQKMIELPDGKKITPEEFKAMTMMRADYTRKTQELSEFKKLEPFWKLLNRDPQLKERVADLIEEYHETGSVNSLNQQPAGGAMTEEQQTFAPQLDEIRQEIFELRKEREKDKLRDNMDYIKTTYPEASKEEIRDALLLSKDRDISLVEAFKLINHDKVVNRYQELLKNPPRRASGIPANGATPGGFLTKQQKAVANMTNRELIADAINTWEDLEARGQTF